MPDIDDKLDKWDIEGEKIAKELENEFFKDEDEHECDPDSSEEEITELEEKIEDVPDENVVDNGEKLREEQEPDVCRIEDLSKSFMKLHEKYKADLTTFSANMGLLKTTVEELHAIKLKLQTLDQHGHLYDLPKKYKSAFDTAEKNFNTLFDETRKFQEKLYKQEESNLRYLLKKRSEGLTGIRYLDILIAVLQVIMIAVMMFKL